MEKLIKQKIFMNCHSTAVKALKLDDASETTGRESETMSTVQSCASLFFHRLK